MSPLSATTGTFRRPIGYALPMPAALPAVELARLEAAREIEVETRSPSGEVHRAIVWVVVSEGRPYLRSYRGPGARWYREAVSGQPVRLITDGEIVDVRVEHVADPSVVRAVSDGFERKYAGDPSTPDMVRPEVLDTTLLLLAG